MDIKTGVIIGSSCGLIAAAILLEPPKSTQATAIFQPVFAPKVSAPVCSGAFSSQDKQDIGVGSFQGTLSQAKVIRSGGDLYASFELNAFAEEGAKRLPLHIAIVIDRSGSMGYEQMNNAKAAAKGLIRRLTSEDQVSIVQYDDVAEIVTPLTSLSDSNRTMLENAIDGISSRGGTNLHGGLVLGRDELVRSLTQGNLNRVLLVSDGLANVGVTDHSTLGSVAASIAAQGVRVSTIGVGVDYDEDLMALLAEQGRGQYHYVRDSLSLQSVFDQELQSMQATVATGVELSLEPLCGSQLVEVFGYPSTRAGNGLTVPLSDIAGGEKRKVVVKLRADATSGDATDLIAATLRFTNPKTGQAQTIQLSLGAAVTEDPSLADASANSAVMTQVLDAESAIATKKAAAAYSKGDVAAAQTIIYQNKAEAQKKAVKYNAAPAAAMKNYDEAEKATLFDPFSSEGKGATKKMKLDSANLSH